MKIIVFYIYPVLVHWEYTAEDNVAVNSNQLGELIVAVFPVVRQRSN